MTIQIRPLDSTNVTANAKHSTTLSAEVWDIDEQSPLKVRERCARPLVRAYRTSARPLAPVATQSNSSAHRGEAARERRDNLLLGLIMTAALAVGSFVGGVFSAGEPGNADPAAAVQMAANSSGSQTR